MFEAGMVAPPGPVSAEALRFTLVKPPTGPCTMTWASTVSPRALDRVMDDVVPGASVCPTLARPGITQAGNAEPGIVLNAIRIVRTRSMATTTIRVSTCRKILCECSPFWRPDLAKTFMDALLPALNCRTGGADRNKTEIQFHRRSHNQRPDSSAGTTKLSLALFDETIRGTLLPND